MFRSFTCLLQLVSSKSNASAIYHNLIYIYIYMYMYYVLYIYVCMHACMHAWMYVCMYVYHITYYIIIYPYSSQVQSCSRIGWPDMWSCACTSPHIDVSSWPRTCQRMPGHQGSEPRHRKDSGTRMDSDPVRIESNDKKTVKHETKASPTTAVFLFYTSAVSEFHTSESTTYCLRGKHFFVKVMYKY